MQNTIAQRVHGAKSDILGVLRLRAVHTMHDPLRLDTVLSAVVGCYRGVTAGDMRLSAPHRTTRVNGHLEVNLYIKR